MKPRLLVLNVGQGDALIAHDPMAGGAVVIDCAYLGARPAVNYLKANNVSELDAVLITHLDADHYAGVPELVREVPAKLYGYGIAKGYKHAHDSVDAFLRHMLSSILRSQAEYKRPLEGLVLDLPGIQIEVLGPTDLEENIAQARNNANFGSAMMKMRVGKLTALLAGDCPPWRWDRILDQNPSRLNADVFMLPHHGAAHTSSPRSLDEVLEAVSPSVVVISVGSENRYGHPRESTIGTVSRWVLRHGARLVCTQLNEYCRINTKGKGRAHVACAGEVVIEHDGTAPVVSVARNAHDVFVRSLAAPRCL